MQIGPYKLRNQLVLAPMAGITNYPFRALCRRFGAALFVSEMITAKSLVRRHTKTVHLASFGPDEQRGIKSIQLYGTHPRSLGEATRMLVEEWGVHHVDIAIWGAPVLAEKPVEIEGTGVFPKDGQADTSITWVPDGAVFAYYLLFFTFGVLFFGAADGHGRPLVDRAGRRWWLMLPAAAVVLVAGIHVTFDQGEELRPLAGALQVAYAWLMIFGLMGLVIKLVSDLTYVWIDPRIDFESRG